MVSSDKTLLSVDFGSEYIRVAKTRYSSHHPERYHPQIVEFSGRTSLRNIMLLSSDKQQGQAWGEEVLLDEQAFDDPGLVLKRLSLDADFESQLGCGTRQLLSYIADVLGLHDLDEDTFRNWQTSVAVPINSSADTAAVWESRLRRVGFPTPTAWDSALAALYYYYEKLVPGFYLVLDLGASHTRAALCDVEQDRSVRVAAVHTGRPGGRDFDDVMIRYFSEALTDAAITNVGSHLELAYFAEEFKKQFSNEWSKGKKGYEALYPVPAVQAVLSLELHEFASSYLAGELIGDFRKTATKLLNDEDVEISALNGVVLMGGGVHWPFVRRWTEDLTKKADVPVLVDEFPEETVVKGLVPLSLLGHTGVLSPTPAAEEPATSPRDQQVDFESPAASDPTARLPSRGLASSQQVFWMELAGGLLGFMGIGWFFGLHDFRYGCLGLLGWWLVLVVGLLGTGVMSAATFNPLPLLILVPIWLLGPLISAMLAARSAKRRALDQSRSEVKDV